MVSRTAIHSMPSASLPTPGKSLVCDIFCTVIDNYGDIGVCWRLARQLTREHGHTVRLWVDDLVTFKRICPVVDPQFASQRCEGVNIRLWTDEFPAIEPGDIVIEAFACHLPASFVEAMAERRSAAVWVNLDYLSAEDWVTEYHALPSPHPRLPLTKYFFFPGFNERTGGLLRENGLLSQREQFCASPDMHAAFWHNLGLTPPDAAALLVSLFAYESTGLPELLHTWAQGRTPIYCLAPATKTLTAIESFAGQALREGDTIHRGNLKLHILPFISQADYDRLLWSCDINFVRGEDSFVRAQWAGKPMIWHIYPQEDDVHVGKLTAFLSLYGDTLPDQERRVLNQFFNAWNTQASSSSRISKRWEDYLAALATYRQHAACWADMLSKQEDLCGQLVRFCQNKL